MDCDAPRVRLGRVGQRGLRVGDVGERDHVDLARAIDAEQDRHRVGTTPARHRDEGVLRGRADRQVVDLDLAGVCAEQRGNLLIDARHVLGAGGAAGHPVTQLERDDLRAGVVRDEQDVVGAEGQRAAGHQRGTLGGRHRRLRRQKERAQAHEGAQRKQCSKRHGQLLRRAGIPCEMGYGVSRHRITTSGV